MALVYKKIKATGQTAQNKGIFIAHIVFVSLYILTWLIPSLLLLFVTADNYYNIFAAFYIITGFSITFEVLIFILVLYVLMKKGGKLKNSNEPLLINITSAEELLKGV